MIMLSPHTKLSGRKSSPHGGAYFDGNVGNCDGVDGNCNNCDGVDGNGGNVDGDLHLDVIDNARLKIDTDSSWDIIAMVPLYRKS